MPLVRYCHRTVIEPEGIKLPSHRDDSYLASTRARDKGSAGRPPARFSRDLLCLAVSDRGVEDTLPADRVGPAWVRRDGQIDHTPLGVRSAIDQHDNRVPVLQVATGPW